MGEEFFHMRDLDKKFSMQHRKAFSESGVSFSNHGLVWRAWYGAAACAGRAAEAP